MKKFLSAVFFMAFFATAVSAHPITVTLSNGKKVVLESDDYPTTIDLVNKIIELENGGN